MKPPRNFPNLTAFAMHFVRANWMLIECARLCAANDDGPSDEPEAA